MFVARMREIGLIFAAAAALASAVCALPAIAAPAESGRSYEFAFERGADRLKSDTKTSDQVASARDLFDHHGWRPELKFRIEAALPTGCEESLKCAEAHLLQRRVQALLAAIEADGNTIAFAPDNLWWGGQAGANATDDDVLRIFVAKGLDLPKNPQCTADIEIADPELPAIDGGGAVLWVSANPQQAIAVSPKAHLRFVKVDPAKRLQISLSDPHGLSDTAPSGASEEFGLVFSGESLVIQIEDPSSADRATQGGCLFRFERWHH
jgi:hypothetical protein